MQETEQVDEGKVRQWRIFGVVFGGVLVLLVSGYWLLLRLDYQTLYSGLPIEDTALVAAELKRQDVRYRVADGGNSIAVPARQIDDIRLALYSADGPTRGLSGFELFNESEMGLTDFAQKIKFQRAIQGELARTIMMIDGVSRARVHIAIPERSVFRSRVVSTKAAVTLIAREGRLFDDSMILGVQRLIASSVPNLSLQNVTVLDGEGRIISKMSTVFDTRPEEETASHQQSTPLAVTLEASLPSQAPLIASAERTETSTLQTDDVHASGSNHLPNSRQKYGEAPAGLVSVNDPGDGVQSETDYALTAPTQSERRDSHAFVLLNSSAQWMLWVLAGLSGLVLGGGFWAFRGRGDLNRDECKAFADELSEMLPGFDAELRHG